MCNPDALLQAELSGEGKRPDEMQMIVPKKNNNLIWLTISLLAMSGIAKAQEWSPLLLGEITNFRRSGESMICCNIRTVSSNFSPGDSVYYLNTVVKDCDDYIVRNLPNFLQRELHITDSAIFFQSPENYLIPKRIFPGDEWVFDTLHKITAMVSQVIQDTVLGSPDSLMIILLNTNDGDSPDSLILSKYHGIVQFPDLQAPGESYLLAGFENQSIGLQMPGEKEFFDFQPGDRFQYKLKYESYGYWSGIVLTTISQYYITDAEKDSSSIVYHKKGLWKETTRQWDPWGLDTLFNTYGVIEEDDTIEFNPGSWMNLYIGQMVPYGNGDFNLLTYQMSPKYNKPMKAKDFRLFGGIGDTLYEQMPYPISPTNVCVGFGITYYNYEDPFGLDYRETLNLEAFVKGEETYGSFTGTCDLLSPEIKAAMGFPAQDTVISIYDQLILTLPDFFDSYLWSDGSDSNALLVDGTVFGNGTHQITVETSYYNCTLTDTIDVVIIDDSGIPNEPPVGIQFTPTGCFEIKNTSFTPLDYFITLIDVSGRLVDEKFYTGQLPGSIIHFCTNELPPGLYILTVHTGGKSISMKVIR